MSQPTKIITVAFEVAVSVTNEQLHELLCKQVHERETTDPALFDTQEDILDISIGETTEA